MRLAWTARTRPFLGIVGGAALLLVAAASPTPDLTGYLAPAPSGDWIESGPSTNFLVGAITAQSYGAWVDDNGATERTMKRDGFVSGFGRVWEQKVTQDFLSEFVLLFTSDSGARSFYNGLKLYDQTSKYYKKDIPALSTAQSVGVEWTQSDGSREFAIDFAKGNLVFDVTMDSESTDLAAMTRSLAQTDFDAAPNSIKVSATSSTISQPAAWTIGVALVVVVGLIATGIFALMRSGRNQPAVFANAAGPQMSPDGAYWWDGARWHDARLEAPPGARRSPDGVYWWDGRSWRRTGS